ncbi:MAG: DUF3102 domain-containing protein, partial [Sedimentisphaerales bacterium]|nr:DUF3102 domain-containing protein [Sedimentisphaerales bacterium]
MTQNQIVQASLFDYGSLNAETRVVVQQKTDEIKTLVRRTAQDIVDIGNKLSDVRNRLPNGQFETWLQAEFNWSRRTAYNFIAVAERFGSANFAQLDISSSALYLLAAPSTSEEAVEEALSRARAGESIGHSTARQIVDDHKPPRYCAACGEQIADDIQGKYCAGLHCKYQGTLRSDLQQAVEDDALTGEEPWDEEGEEEPETPTAQPPVARVVTVPRTEPPASPPPPPPPRPEPKPPEPARIVSTGAPAMQPLPPRPAPVMRSITPAGAPKATVISIRILPGDGPLSDRQIMAAIADEGDFPRTMEGGTFANLHDIVDRICTAF